MADGLFYRDLREPFIGADVASVTLSTTDKALYPKDNFPLLGGQYWARIGKKLHVRVFGRITTAATPGNLTLSMYLGDGTDANGTVLAASAAQTLIANQTNLSWWAEFWVHCRAIGASGSLFCTGKGYFNTSVIAAGDLIIPASAPVVTTGLDLTAAKILSVQAKRSGSTAETMQVHDMEVEALN